MFFSLNLTLRRLLYIIAYLKVLHFIIIFKPQLFLLEYKIRFLIYYLWVFYRKTNRENLSLEIHSNNVKKLLNYGGILSPITLIFFWTILMGPEFHLWGRIQRIFLYFLHIRGISWMCTFTLLLIFKSNFFSIYFY